MAKQLSSGERTTRSIFAFGGAHMMRLSVAMMRSIARALSLPENTFDSAFDGGISTLRLTHYPRQVERVF